MQQQSFIRRSASNFGDKEATKQNEGTFGCSDDSEAEPAIEGFAS